MSDDELKHQDPTDWPVIMEEKTMFFLVCLNMMQLVTPQIVPLTPGLHLV